MISVFVVNGITFSFFRIAKQRILQTLNRTFCDVNYEFFVVQQYILVPTR